jgi:hypothetical protein
MTIHHSGAAERQGNKRARKQKAAALAGGGAVGWTYFANL